MKSSYEENLNRWLERVDKNDPLYAELKELAAAAAGNGSEPVSTVEKARSELKERFYKELEFGTGGLRGILGAGTNRLNIYTVGKASQGLADYMKAAWLPLSVAIAYDTRINSRLFAETAAGVFAANGIEVYMYDSFGTVPMLSFAVRELHCGMGVIVTASHNPSEYNGYKVYCADGYQITDRQAADILAHINETDIFDDVLKTPFEEAAKSADFHLLREDFVELFLENCMKKSALTDGGGLGELKTVYTPLNGAGNVPVRKMLSRLGVRSVSVVAEQEQPDGNFPTCPYPNPEKTEVLELGLSLCRRTEADLLVATDPDCDRVGTAIRTADGYMLPTGNQMGLLMLEYIAERRCEKGAMPERPVAIRSIVTARLADKIAAAYGIEMKKTLTGFKYVGELMTELEKSGRSEDFVFAFEESYGYLADLHCRDKDGVNAAMIICQMAAYYKSKGITLAEALDALYEKYGYEDCRLLNFEFKGISGAESIAEIMRDFREDPLREAAGRRLIGFTDHKTQQRHGYTQVGEVTASTGLPASDVLEYVYEDGLSFAVRPSGTEPKLKIYTFAEGKSGEAAAKLSEELTYILRRKTDNE